MIMRPPRNCVAGGHRLTWAYHNLPAAVFQPGGFQALVDFQEREIFAEKCHVVFFTATRVLGFLASTHRTIFTNLVTNKNRRFIIA